MKLFELYQEEPNSTVTHDGTEYNLNTLFKLVDKDPVAYFNVSDLKWILTEDRTSDADLEAPVLVTIWDHKYVILDGGHRLRKAVKEKVQQLPGRFVSPDQLKKAKIK